jgi:hypothetical protein
MFPSFQEAARLYDRLNAWGCQSPTGCHGRHSIHLIVPS